MWRLIALVLIGVALTGCTDDRPPRWVEHCVESHPEMRITYGYGLINLSGGHSGGPGLHLTPTDVCDRHELVCRPAGKDYTGPQTGCGPKPTEN